MSCTRRIIFTEDGLGLMAVALMLPLVLFCVVSTIHDEYQKKQERNYRAYTFALTSERANQGQIGKASLAELHNLVSIALDDYRD